MGLAPSLGNGWVRFQPARSRKVGQISTGVEGCTADRRLAVCQAQSAPLVAELEAWLRAQLNRLIRGSKCNRCLDLSRFCAAPLITYFAAKEMYQKHSQDG